MQCHHQWVTNHWSPLLSASFSTSANSYCSYSSASSVTPPVTPLSCLSEAETSCSSSHYSQTTRFSPLHRLPPRLPRSSWSSASRCASACSLASSSRPLRCSARSRAAGRFRREAEKLITVKIACHGPCVAFGGGRGGAGSHAGA